MESQKTMEPNSIDYWKKQAKHYEQKANDIQQELDEYTENSAQLEKELEASLLQVEKQNRDLENQNQRLKNEIELLRGKLERSHQETTALESELQSLKIDKDKQAAYVRELEQKNDDLERGQRIISESVSCIETLLNQAYERNAVLESEVDEKENLRVQLQRVSDEARDLKQELKVIDRIPVHKKEEESANENGLTNGHVPNSTKAQVETETQTILTSPQKREINGNAMTPSARVSAINIVGDLLRKVGLERFLCRECGKVKCSCATENATVAIEAVEINLSSDVTGQDHVRCPNDVTPRKVSLRDITLKTDKSNGDEDIEYRNPRSFSRQLSGPQNPSSLARKPPLVNRSSEQPFSRNIQGENEKLRRSFAIRSREGLENLFSFKKNNNQDKL